MGDVAFNVKVPSLDHNGYLSMASNLDRNGYLPMGSKHLTLSLSNAGDTSCDAYRGLGYDFRRAGEDFYGACVPAEITAACADKLDSDKLKPGASERLCTGNFNIESKKATLLTAK